MRFRKAIGAALLGLMLVLVGCSKISKSNYDKIETGMSKSQVESILGKGTDQAGVSGAIGTITGSGGIVKWGDENKWITVTFANEKVVAKAAQGL